MTGDRPIVVFDAECLLCSVNAQFVLRHDRAGHFLLASMQGDAGAGLYRRFGLDFVDPRTLILVEGDRLRRDSDAVLAIWAGLGWPWRAGAVFRLISRTLRDLPYRWVACTRYRLFGRRATCWLPEFRVGKRMLRTVGPWPSAA